MKNVLMILAIIGTLALTATSHAAPVGPPSANNATETEILKGTSADINGVFKVSLPMYGRALDSTFSLSCDGSEVTGHITNPNNPNENCEIYDGTANGNHFDFYTKIGETEFHFEGTAGKGKLSMMYTTTETFHLDDGFKIKTSQETLIDGAYLVPTRSPGGVMENIFFLKTEGDVLTGQMIMIGNPLRDTSEFFDGTVNGNKISFYSKTAQQTLFHFTGTIEGDKIKLKQIATDVVKGVVGSAM